MFDDLIAEVFAKGPRGGPGGSCRGLEGAHMLISGDRGGPRGGRRASSGAAGGQEAMELIALGVPEINIFGAFTVFLQCFLICDVI